MTTIIHELGHAIDNEIIFKQKHTVDLRCAYDLSNEDERNKYFKNSAISLWGEFFAESFVYIACPELRNLAKSKTSDLLNCIDNYRGIGVSPIDRAYRILYLFTHIIAQSGKPGFDYSVLNINEQYIHFLKTVELELFRILEKYPEVNIASDFDIINKEFYDLCIFEYKQHI